jgi:16S rRNA (guanine527-N7)-methyltransferase
VPLAGPPVSARAVLGDQLPAAERYAALLAGPGVERGLIGPAEAARIWDRHILNCAVVAELVPDRCLLADLGSGAGLPGIVLALLRPQAEVVLIESLARRVAFLDECVTELGLTHVRILRGRAEDLAGEVRADIVTARAVAPLARLAGWAIGLCRPGGTVLAIKGANAAAELAAAGADLRRLGATGPAVLQVGSGIVDPPATVVRFAAPRPSRAAARRGSRPGSRGQKGRGSGAGAPGFRSGGRPAGGQASGGQARQGRPGGRRPPGETRGPRPGGR